MAMLRITSRWVPALVLVLLLACSETDTPYFPLSSGRWWQYHVRVGNSATQWEYKILSRNLSLTASQGEHLAVRRMHNGELHYFRTNANGVWHLGVRKTAADPVPVGPGELSLPLPLDTVRAWNAPDETRVLRTRAANDYFRDYVVRLPINIRYRVSELDTTVRTRFGVFDNCVHIKGSAVGQFDLGIDVGRVKVDVAINDWYAKDIGLIRRERHERTDSPFINDGDYLLELESWGR